MAEQAIKPQAASALPLGAEEASGGNRIYVNLRLGRIAQTSNEQLPGFEPASTTNLDGSVNHFFAKTYHHITGFVDDIQWRSHELPNKTMLTGWNVTVRTDNEVYVLGIGSKERPYQPLMATLINVDFSRPVMFVGFMGSKTKKEGDQWVKTGEKHKMLLLAQEINPENGKPLWLKPAYEPKFLTRLIINKLKEGVELSEFEERSVSRMADGKFNKEYPYVVEEEDQSEGKYDWRAYNRFLKSLMDNEIIPEVKRCAAVRVNTAPPAIMPDVDIPTQYSDPEPAAYSDDDIPF